MKTVDDVEIVEDAIILAHLRAAKVNIDYACKDFKKYHYRFKDTRLSDDFKIIRCWVDGTLNDMIDFCNAKVRGMREERIMNMFNGDNRRSTKKMTLEK